MISLTHLSLFFSAVPLSTFAAADAAFAPDFCAAGLFGGISSAESPFPARFEASLPDPPDFALPPLPPVLRAASGRRLRASLRRLASSKSGAACGRGEQVGSHSCGLIACVHQHVRSPSLPTH
jgi:hypothetical protein